MVNVSLHQTPCIVERQRRSRPYSAINSTRTYLLFQPFDPFLL